jgi:hypothetical protein
MEERSIRRVPVVRDGDLAGIVSRADLLQAGMISPAPFGSEEAEDKRIREAVWKEVREQPWGCLRHLCGGEGRDGAVPRLRPLRRRPVRAARYRPGVPGVKGVEDDMEEGIPRSALY